MSRGDAGLWPRESWVEATFHDVRDDTTHPVWIEGYSASEDMLLVEFSGGSLEWVNRGDVKR
jgi:hypothetical protein